MHRKLLNVFWTALILLAIVLPILWMFLLSLKTRVEMLSDQPSLLAAPTLVNWRAAFSELGARTAILNSFTIAASSSVIALAIGVPGGYWLSRATTKGKDPVLFSIIAAR